MRSFGGFVTAVVAVFVMGESPVALARAPYAVGSARHPSVARFLVTYRGSGSWHTVYHSEPPNPGGAHDTNDAHDSSTQSWSLRYTRALVIPECGRAAGQCRPLGDLDGATGPTRASGTIDHTHIDGLYPADDASVRCSVAAVTPPRARLRAILSVRYLPTRKSIALTAQIPVADALIVLPSACPGQGDSLDGLADNYYTPGFSFAAGFGPGRWFVSEQVVIPTAVLHRAARINVRLSQTPRGTPPADCSVAYSYERCRTGGSWNALLSLSAVR